MHLDSVNVQEIGRMTAVGVSIKIDARIVEMSAIEITGAHTVQVGTMGSSTVRKGWGSSREDLVAAVLGANPLQKRIRINTVLNWCVFILLLTLILYLSFTNFRTMSINLGIYKPGLT